MFSLYGINGPVFTDPLEAMNRIHPANWVSGVHAIDPDAGVGARGAVSAMTPGVQDHAILAYRRAHGDLERGPLYHASEVMNTPVITLQATDAVARAWRLLRDQRIHQAPVVDAANQLVGIVSERDLLTAIDIEGDRVIETLRRQVQDVMTTPVAAAAATTDIRHIAAVMLANGVDGVPIANERGRLIGFVSRSDILRAVVTDPPLSLWR